MLGMGELSIEGHSACAASHAMTRRNVAARLAIVIACVCAIAVAMAFGGTTAYAAQATVGASDSATALSAGKIGALAKSKSKYVMIGDSYACPRDVKGFVPWPELVSKQLGLGKDGFKAVRKGGYGFAKSGKDFYSLIIKQPKDEKVTDVLIVGGIGNDRYSSLLSIQKAYDRTIKLLKKKYPNARIMYSIVNWRPKDLFYQFKIVTRLPFYQGLAKRNGVKYLAGCEKVMRKHPTWYLRDQIHPNAAGQRLIAQALVTRINKLDAAKK